MRSILALAAVAGIAFSAPALAQEAGAPGAVGVEGSLTGSNPPGSSVNPRWTYNGPGYDQENPGFAAPFFFRGPGLIEGRAAAEDYPSPPPDDFADPTPRTVRGDQNGQDMAR